MNQRVRVIFTVISLALFVIFNATLGRERSELQSDFDEFVESYASVKPQQAIRLELKENGGSFVIDGRPDQDEAAYRALNLMREANIFSRASQVGDAKDAVRIVVSAGSGRREFSVEIPRSEFKRDIRAQNLLRLFELKAERPQ